MTVVIRPGDVLMEKELILQSLGRFLLKSTDGKRHHWLYVDNPQGASKVWFAESDGLAVGVGAAFSRRIRQGKDIFKSWVLGDFCLDPRFRSLGPALALQRECLRGVAGSETAFVYDFPSAAMVAIYQRLKISPCQSLTRWARPLRIDRLVRQKVPVRGAREVISATGNTFLRASRISWKTSSLMIANHEQRCGEEFTDLADEIAADGLPRIDHSAAYLNWRYLDNPTAKFRIVTARDAGGGLRAYAVYTVAGEDATIVDLFGIVDQEVVWALVNFISFESARARVQTLSAPLSESHPYGELFRRLGFRKRESSPIVVVASDAFQRALCPLSDIPFMQGDRDS